MSDELLLKRMLKNVSFVAEQRAGQAVRQNAEEEKAQRERLRSIYSRRGGRLIELQEEFDQARKRGATAHDLEQIEALMDEAGEASDGMILMKI